MIFEWAWSKMVKIFSSWDPKICCTLRMNLRIQLIFWMLLYLLFSNGERQKYRGHFVWRSLLHFFMFIILHHYFAKVASVTSTIIISLGQEDCSQIFQPRSYGKAGKCQVWKQLKRQVWDKAGLVIIPPVCQSSCRSPYSFSLGVRFYESYPLRKRLIAYNVILHLASKETCQSLLLTVFVIGKIRWNSQFYHFWERWISNIVMQGLLGLISFNFS